jgi:hypothetical protein
MVYTYYNNIFCNFLNCWILQRTKEGTILVTYSRTTILYLQNTENSIFKLGISESTQKHLITHAANLGFTYL